MRLGSVLTDKDLNYSTLQVSLDGFEEWLGTRTPMPKFKRGPRVSLNHVGRKNVVYSLDDGSITIDFDISITYTGSGGTEFILKQKPTMTYRFRKQKKSETVFHTHRGLNDILLLVTNCERTLAWPIIKHRRARTWTDVYFGIPDRNQEPLSRTSCWTNFPEIEQDFGKVLSAWRSRFSDHYPAFYLYGGTRRQKRIYTEHKFINLMWGLEALSNPSYKVTRNAALITKIGRITKAISESGLKSSDKSWAIKSTERALKPTLADRLTEILASLSININASKIARFSQRCADARNSLSHEGGARSNALYDDFIQDVFKLSIGLDIIYHLKLLQELGLGNLHIQAILNTIFSSYDVRARLKHADLEPDRLYM